MTPLHTMVAPLRGIPVVELAPSHGDIKGCGIYLYVFIALALDDSKLSPSHHTMTLRTERDHCGTSWIGGWGSESRCEHGSKEGKFRASTRNFNCSSPACSLVTTLTEKERHCNSIIYTYQYIGVTKFSVSSCKGGSLGRKFLLFLW
jgi:hypothetical protein